jgi:D-glycero-beta-D-manno-heptose-7-phosphate kinase
MMILNIERARKLVSEFKDKRILVLGDLMLDKYIWGHVSRISPEAPVPVVEVHKDTSCLGGAGNVCQNLLSLGARPLLVGVVGDDEYGLWIKDNLRDNRGILVDKARPTTVKTRIIAHHQQVVRVDQERKSPVSAEVEEQIFTFLSREKYHGLVLSDYNKGVLTGTLMNRVLPLAKQKGLPVFVDPKVENFRLFSPVTLITPNHFEAEKIVQHECRTDPEVEKAGYEIMSKADCRYLILKRGEQGMTVFEEGRTPLHIPTIAKEVFDVTGAGDTVIAAASLALLSGASIYEAAVIANIAAGIVVGKIGTATATPSELLDALQRETEK